MSNEFKLQLIIKSLQELGYNDISNQLTKHLQQDQSSLSTWFFQLFNNQEFNQLDDYLTKLINQQKDPQEFLHLLDYDGEYYQELLMLMLYLIRRFNLPNQTDQLNYLTYKLLPILDELPHINEFSNIINKTILNQINRETESTVLLNNSNLQFNLDDNYQTFLMYKFFKKPPISFEIPSLSTIIDQAIKYQQLQSPLYLPPRTKYDSTTSSIQNFNTTLLHTLTYHQDEVWFVKFSPSGKFMVTGSLDGRLILYDVLNNFQLIKILEPTQQQESSKFKSHSSKPTSGKKKAIIYCCWDPNERYIVSCCLDTVIRIWSVTESKLITCFTLGQDIKTWSCEFLPNSSSFVIGSPDKFLKIFDIEGNELFNFYENIDEEPDSDDEEIKNNFNRINDLAITPNGKILITANNDRQLHFYSIPDVFNDESTTRKLACINLKDSLKGRLTSCSISSNGKYLLVSFAPEELQVWEINHDKPILYRKFFGHSQSTFIIRSTFGYLVEENKQEELVISGAFDGSIYLWKLSTGQLIKRIKGHLKLCNAVDWNLKGGVINGKDFGKIWASVSDDKLVKIWCTDRTDQTFN